MPIRDTLLSHLKKDQVQIFLSVGSLLALIFNFWLATKLYPLVETDLKISGRIDAVESRVLAAETELNSNNEVAKVLIERFYKLEENVSGLEGIVMEIRQDVKDMTRDVDAIKGALLR